MRVYVIYLLLLISLSSFSQKGTGYFGISMGTNIPVGEFGKARLANESGFATSGFLMDFSGTYFFNYYLGGTAVFAFGMNGIQDEALQEKLTLDLPPSVPPSADITFQLGNWSDVSILTGPVLTLPLGKINLDAKALAGVSFVHPPKTEVSAVYPTGSFNTSRNKQDVVFGILTGLAIRYHLNDAYSLKFGMDYYYSSPEISVDSYEILETAKTDFDPEVYKLDMHLLKINMGLLYRF